VIAIPGSGTLFLALFTDGCMTVFPGIRYHMKKSTKKRALCSSQRLCASASQTCCSSANVLTRYLNMFCPAALCEEAQNNRLKAFEVLPEEKVDNGG
jgi:hypothetical protein